jgi:CCR4-NOT transcription complex subunit 4
MNSDDQGLPSLDEATQSVDALVADSSVDDFGAPSLDSFDQLSRTSTPSVPPGFTLPHAHPSPATREALIAKPLSLIPTSAPFTPSRSSSFIPRVATPLSHVSIPAIPLQDSPTPKAETSTLQAKQEIKTLATVTGLSKTIASQSSQPALQSEDFPALDGGKGKSISMPAASKSATTKTATMPLTTKKSTAGSTSFQSNQSATKVTDKHVASGLNISVPVKSSAKVASPETTTKPIVPSSAFPSLPTSTAPATTSQSPLSRNTPKTLRLTSIPKPEIPATGSATPTSVTSMFPPNSLPSRQPSLASISRLDRPGTPTSEIVSDNASITSASMSRASSPPPSKVGSAPVRQTTKSMQRKQRREAQKEKERTELGIVVAKIEPEVEIAPIMGRKKKQKKERTLHSAAGGSTPTVSRPVSPGPVDTISQDLKHKVEPQPVTQAIDKQPANEQETVRAKGHDSKGRGKSKAQRPATPETATPTPEIEDEVADKPIPTPAVVFADLVSAGIITDVNNLYLLKNPTVNHRHQDNPIDIQSVNQKLTITPEDRATLLAGLPVHKIVEGPSRIMLTPNGDCVRNLTPEEEDRYLELQSRIQDESGPTAFVSAKHHASNGFTLVSSRAVPNGPPSFFPVFNGTSTMDPVSKIQRDEALSYINQYVLPSLSSNSQVEKALNANALDTEMLRSVDASAWASWGTDPAIPNPDTTEGAYGSVNREGIIATGLENMTAHFAIGGDINRGQPLGNVSLLSLGEAESAMQIARKETEGLEKRLNALIKKNRRLLLGSGH